MLHAARIPARPVRDRGRRLVAMLGAALLTAGAVAAIAPAESAEAAELACNQNTLYAIATSGQVSSIDATTGVTTGVVNMTPANNALGISTGGANAYAYGSSAVRRYNAAAGTAPSQVATDSGVATNPRGAVNPVNGLYYYGATATGTGANAQMRVGAYDPATNTALGQVAVITGEVSGGGDFAFSGTGVLFIVADNRVLRANAAMPSTSGTTQVKTTLVGTLQTTALNGIAFSRDGYLFLSGGSTATALRRVNPASGAEVDQVPTSPAVTPLDLASCNYANTTAASSEITERKNPTDQFGLAITGGGITTGNTGTSTGADTTVTAGPVPAIGGTVYTVTQSPQATTSAADYVTTWRCVRADGTLVDEGDGPVASYTQPLSTTEASSDVTCTFTNVLAADAADDTATTTAGAAITIAGLLANDDGVDLEITGVGTPTRGGSAELQADGTIAYTPAADVSGVETFTYDVVDASGNVSTATVRVTITPTADADSVSVPAGPATVIPTATLLDGDHGTSLEIVAASVLTGGGSVAVNGDGDVVYTPAAGTSGPASFSYTVEDAAGQQVSATVTVTVAPTAGADTVTAPAGSSTVFDQLLVNDRGTGLQIVDADIVTGGGDVTVDADGDVVYTPATGYSGPASFTYTVRDASGTEHTTTVTVAVTPTAGDDARNADAGGTTSLTGLLGNDLGTGLAITAVSGGSQGGSVAITGAGSVDYTPAAGFSGTETFTYTVTDAAGRTDTATVTVTVSPTARDDARTASAETATTLGGLLGNDRGTGLEITAVSSGSAGGSIAIAAGGAIAYTPADGFSGTETFTYTVTDDAGRTDTATVTVTVAATAANDTGTTPAETELSVAAAQGVLANDAGSELEVTAFTQPANGQVEVEADGAYVYQPAAGFSGDDTFTYTVTDANDVSLTRTVTIAVVPTADDDAVSTIAGQSVTAPVRDGDVGTGLQITDLSAPAGGTVAVTADQRIQYTPATGWSGIDTVDYEVTDDAGRSATATLTVRVAPRALPDDAQTAAGTTLDLAPTLLLADDLGRELTVTSVADASSGAVSLLVDGTVRYVPADGFSGTATFSYTVTGAGGLTSTAVVTVLVGTAAEPDTAHVTAGNTLNVSAASGVLANDSGSGLTATLDAGPQHGTLTLNADGSYRYTPADGFSGTDTFTYTATDAEEQVTTGLVTITVTPTAGDDTATVTAGGTLQLAAPGVLENDLGADLEVTGFSPALHGTLVVGVDGTVTYTPEAGFSGTETITYEVTDAEGQTAEGTLVITVGILAVDDTATAVAGTPLVVTAEKGLLANDGGTDLRATLATGAAHGTVVVNLDGSYRYTPAPGFTGTDTFTYTATDGNGVSTTATVTITVEAVGVGTNDRVVAKPGQPVVIDPFANDRPTGGAELDESSLRLIDPVTGEAVLSVTVEGEGVWTIEDGKIVFTPEPDFDGTASIEYQVTDTAGQVLTARVTVAYPSALAATGTVGGLAMLVTGLGAMVFGGLLLLRRRRPAEA